MSASGVNKTAALALLGEVYDAEDDNITIDSAFDTTDEGDTPTNTGTFMALIYECMIKALDAPQRILDHIGQTRALDGQQTDEWTTPHAGPITRTLE
jgi:hypothetical protein